MSKKNFIFIFGLIMLVFILALTILYYFFDSKIEQNRFYYEEKLRVLELEIKDNTKYDK